nr:copia protein [Tanacetum cinerariifolium]
MQQLKRNERLMVGNDETLKKLLFSYFHESAIGGHSGGDTTMHKLDSLVYLKGMRKFVKQWARELVDKLTKYANFIILVHPYTASAIAQVFLDHIYKLHVLPTLIISDKDKIFVPPIHVPYHHGESLIEDVDRTLQVREQEVKIMKNIADKHRSDRSFEPGMKVYLKLQLHRQVTVRVGTMEELESVAVLERRLGKLANRPVIYVLDQWKNQSRKDESSSSKPQDYCSTDVPERSGNSNPTATSTNPPADQLETLPVETPIPTVSSLVPTACLNDSPEPSSDTRLISKRVSNQVETPSLDNILTLTNRFEDILGVTTNLVDSDRVKADVTNMETNIIASPTPTLKIHKDHPKSQIIGLVDTPIQTRNKSKKTLVDCPKGVRPIRTKWVLKNKKDERGIVIRNKARLVAQGHTQEEGIDYDEVFALVVRIEANKLFLAYASFIGFTIYQMDVKSAFCNAPLRKEDRYVIIMAFHQSIVKKA